MTVVNAVLSVALAAAPWLLFGLFAAGLIRALVPEQALRRWVGGAGLAGVSRAAVIGAPLPLCSCGAIPTALALHRGGAGRGPTTAFLVGTPGIGMDSVAITYALLGPFMAVARAAGAVAAAIGTGLMVAASGERRPVEVAPAPERSGECGDGPAGCAPDLSPTAAPPPLAVRLRAGIRYAFVDLLDDISGWIFAGLIIAGVLIAFVPPETLSTYGSGPLPMLLMAVIGIPLYICATAATPIAAGMLAAGVSPGTVLVFLLAGPVTSMATLGVFRREMGTRALVHYMLGIVSTTLLAGVLVDHLAGWLAIDVVAQIGAVRELLPEWLEWAALAILVLVAVRPVRRALGRLVSI